MSKLLIVESPTKARTIGKMLGSQFDIVASMGHIRDLPEHELGVDVEHDFAPLYVETPRSRQVIKNLKAAAKNADGIYLAPDPDREGEAIAWHLKEVLAGTVKAPFYRVTFHEITRGAIENALRHTGEIDQNLVDAQQARRVLDRIVGYKVSPLLWRKLEKGRSAGRVQSAALRLVVEREREITAFTPEEYWSFTADFTRPAGELFRSRLAKIDGQDFKIGNAEAAAALEAAVNGGGTPTVVSVSAQVKRRNAPPPFTTSTLQQSANNVLHYSASSTMRYAQQLYEGVDLGDGSGVGLITYMRTDSVTLSRESQVAAAEFIAATYGKEFLPPRFNYFKNKSSAQEAHEAIRPTDVRRTPEAVAPYLDAPQLKLYTLIWKRFVASQMAQAVQNQHTLEVDLPGADGKVYRFRASATETTFAGYTALFNDGAKLEDEKRAAAILRSAAQGEKLRLTKFEPTRKFTEPPPRYSEAALIKALEENGIGRPSTYATILRTIQDRGYVGKEQGKLVPEAIGFAVNDFLVERLPKLFDIGFTADMETHLDEIEQGKLGWVAMMQDFYRQLTPWIKAANEFDAPPAESSRSLLDLLRKIDFSADAQNRYDNDKFLASVEKKFARSGKISAKQQRALVTLASRFINSIPPEELAKLPEALREELQLAAQQRQEDNVRRATDAEAAAKVDYAGLFAAFDEVKFAPPETRGKITYDDEKFFRSLKKQALGGKLLSDKQLAALGKLAKKYRPMLKNSALVNSMLKLPETAAPADAAATSVVELPALFAALDKAKFEPPVKRGRFTYDDRKFFDSLKKQYFSGRQLSDKQTAALHKLAAKYGVEGK